MDLNVPKLPINVSDSSLNVEAGLVDIGRRAKTAGIETRIGNHTFRVPGIATYSKEQRQVEIAQQMANHESPQKRAPAQPPPL